MSTTEQRTPDAEATRADRGGWAVPGVEHVPAAGRVDASGPGCDVQSHVPPATEPTPGSDCATQPSTDPDTELAPGPGASPITDGSDHRTAGGSAGQPERDLTGELVDDLAGELADATTGGLGTTGGGHPVVVAVLACLEALDTVRQSSVGTLNAREIRLMLLAVAQIIAAAFALKLRLLAAGKVQRIEDLTGATSTAAFLAHLTQMRRPDAAAQVRLATDLDHHYPLLADALARGLLSPDQLSPCVAALRRLPKDLPAEQLEACQTYLVDAAQRLTPSQLRTVGRHLWEVIDPDGADAKVGKDLQDEEEQARAKAAIRFWDNGDGTTGFRGKLPHLQAAILRKALQALAAPRRRNNPNIPTGQPDDQRHRPTRPSPGDDPSPPGDDGQPADARPDGQPSDDPDPQTPPPEAGSTPGDDDPRRLRFDDHGRDSLDGDITPEERDTGRTVPYPVRLGHALIELLERLPEGILPTTGGVPATIIATLTLDELRTGLGTATLDTGEEVSAGQLRRLACNAGIIPAVLDGTSQPLDLGRRQRLFTPYQRIALQLRDRGGTANDDPDGSGCVIDGCDRPASVCEAHHPTAWEDGGRTDLDNGILLCPYHHHRAHDTRWQLTRANNTWRLRRLTS